MRDLQYPEDARRVIDTLHIGLQYDAAVAVLGLTCSRVGLAEVPDLSTGIKFGGRGADEAVRRDAPGLLSRFSLISMVSRIERHAQLLLLQRRVIEELGSTGQKMQPGVMWTILRRVHSEARGGPVKLCSELVVTNPSLALLDRMAWLEGIVKVRNCLAHRLGQASLEDVKPSGVPLDQTKETDTLKVVWLRLKASLNGTEIKAFPHQGGVKIMTARVGFPISLIEATERPDRTRRSTRAADRADSEIKGSWPPPGYLGRSAWRFSAASGLGIRIRQRTGWTHTERDLR